MKTKLFAVVGLACLAALLTGCIATVDGHTRAAVPFRKDKISSKYEFPVAKVFAAAKEVLKINGVLESENTLNHSYVARVNERAVYVLVEEIQPTVAQITVQVRTKLGGPDIDLAAELDKQIALQLSQEVRQVPIVTPLTPR